MKAHENNIDHLSSFISLNEEWIATHFKIEDVDRELARNPLKILTDGGYVFSLTDKEEVIGGCALFQQEEGVYELARMAVSPQYQAKGHGNTLMEIALKKLIEIGASKVFLVSNTKLKSAISLYKKHQFTTIHEGPHPVYSRADIIMERSME